MKYILTLLLLFTIPFSVSAEQKDNSDLTQFDYPLLLGSWKFPNSNVIVTFYSDYSYFIEMYTDVGLSSEYGKFEYQEDKITFNSNSGDVRAYDAEHNYNYLFLDTVPFRKIPKLEMLGVWSSRDVYAESSPETNALEISFSPDFIFKMVVKSKNKEKEVIGVYSIETDKILLTTGEGQTTGDIVFRDNMMVLDLENGDLRTSLVRN